MGLHPDWKKILKRAWSVRLIVLAAVLSGVEVVLPFLGDFIPQGTFAALSFLTVAGAFIARILAQKDFPDGT